MLLEMNKKLISLLVIFVFLFSFFSIVDAVPIKLVKDVSKDKKSDDSNSKHSSDMVSKLKILLKSKANNNSVSQNIEGNNQEITGPIRITRAEVEGSVYV